MAITVEIDGKEFTGFEEITVFHSMENFSGDFTIQAAPTDDIASFPIKIGKPVRIFVNNQVILTGYVDGINVSYDSNPYSHTFNITGRDKTCDIIDSTLGTLSISAPITLKQIAENILKKLGIADIKVLTDEGLNIKAFQEGDIIAFPFGTSAFDILESYAHKRQVLVTTDGKGNILFSNGTTTNRFKTVLSLSPKTKNTIKSGMLRFDEGKLFYEYVAQSAASDSSSIDSDTDQDNEAQTNINSDPVLDTSITRKTRIYNFITENPCNKGDATLRAQWEANFRRTQSKNRRYTIALHEPPDDKGKIWDINYLVQVEDEFSNANTELLISKVTYRYNLQNGSETDLELVAKDSFTVELTKPEKEKQEGSQDADDFAALPTI